MKSKIILTILVLTVSATQCVRDYSTTPIDEPLRPLNSVEKHLIQSDNSFGIKLFKELSNDTQKNVFISPLSVALALGMAYNGADGSTEEAIRQTMGLGNLDYQEINESFFSLIKFLSQLDSGVQFEIANSIWCRLGFSVENKFLNDNQNYFLAEVKELDFSQPSAVSTINSWIDTKTHGKIKDVIQNIDPLTMLYIINAIYFKGTWTYEFDKDHTKSEDFNLLDGTTISCQMMKQTSDFAYFESDAFQVIDLPYGNEKFSMTIFLPKTPDSLDDLIAGMNPAFLEQWLSKLEKQTVTVHLPKLKIEYDELLLNSLSNLGMSVAFDPNNANFSKINKDTQLYIRNILHKTFLEVDEEGTEAAAVTVIDLGLTSVGPQNTIMRIDHPFVLLIRENHSNTILFVGKIVNPKSSS